MIHASILPVKEARVQIESFRGPKGEKGDAYIHIGPEAPEDPSVVLWVDTNESGGGAGGGINEGALLEMLESLGLVTLMRDHDGAAITDGDGAYLTL